MIRTIFCFGILSLFSILACKSQKAMPDKNDKTPFLAFQQYGCRGFCPSYILTFYNNGVFSYEGKGNVALMGMAEKNVTPAELNQLKKQVAAVNLWQYPERIESQVADAPYASFTVMEGEKQHSVMGSIDRPKPLLELEALVKNLAEAHGLSVKQGIDPNALPADAPELLVKLKTEVNAGNWVMGIQNVKLRLIRRVSAENTWLLAYDPKQISAEQLIETLKALPDVLEVQRNKKTSDRN
ncbi:MAG: DUF6438 domain-containing protein [Saprospiraceae bacterium]|nr:DUF6438 domain-containing protein [Saprospiraceae bacterium]